MDRRAVRAVQANAVGMARIVAVVVTGEGGAHFVVGHAEPGRPGPPDGQAGQLRLGLVEGAAPQNGVDGGDGPHQRVHEPVIHASGYPCVRLPCIAACDSQAAICEAIARRCSSRTSSTP